MTDTTGPVLPRWLLAENLKSMRSDAGMHLREAAGRLRVTEVSIRRFEAAQTLPSSLQLEALCDLYGTKAKLGELEGLRELARQPGWWNSNGPRPQATSALLGMEIAAVRIRSFDHSAIPGLLQTPAYARGIMQAIDLGISQQQLHSDVELRMARQAKVFDDPGREVNMIVDETALQRIPGPIELRRSQLARLLNPPATTTVQILPFSAGPHPALAGFVIFDFDSDVVSRGVYTEWSPTTQASVVAGEDVPTYEHVWERIRAMALTTHESAKFITRMMEAIADE